jgi:hypothetical protein
VPTSAGHTICLREDGSQELEESSFLSLREPDEAPSPIGGGRVPDFFDIKVYKQQVDQHVQRIHDAAVRLGTKGGIASGLSRRR